VVGSDVAWQQRVDEWTPDVSARAWARTIADRADGKDAREVLLVAADDDGKLSALVSGSAADDDRSGSIAEIGALYVVPDRRGQGFGGSLLLRCPAVPTGPRDRVRRATVTPRR